METKASALLFFIWLACRATALEVDSDRDALVLLKENNQEDLVDRPVGEQPATVVRSKRQMRTASMEEALRNELARLASTVASLQATVEAQQVTVDQLRSGDAASCDDLRRRDASLATGMHWIDPDGVGRGRPPVRVHCDMSTGTTYIGHDSEDYINVGHCSQPGCYSRSIRYNVDLEQMAALIDQSDDCRQSVEYECFVAPLEFAGLSYSWWNDRHGRPRYFWSGADPSSHTCQCGIDGVCVDPQFRCHCDAMTLKLLTDSGSLTNKTLLPVTSLHFGRTTSGRHRLGALQCRGRARPPHQAASCSDLRLLGHRHDAFYVVRVDGVLRTVYCHMDYETDMESVVEERAPVHFDVALLHGVPAPQPFRDHVITFDVENVNVGDAMNFTSGVFTVPVTGTYFFTFTASTQKEPGMEEGTSVLLKTSAEHLEWASDNPGPHILLHRLARLRAGERVFLVLEYGEIAEAASNFIGMLLQ